jgi:cytochrome bd ubiquinol oxidase subunit II
MIADTLAAVIIAVTTAYAALAGADFGGGIWDLLAGSAVRGEVPRRRIDQSITPVWESNHVWLIIAVVLLWTGFPAAFAAVFTTLFVPLSVAALGIVLRGTGFAFRPHVRTLRWQAATGGVFAMASLLTPFFMGTVVGSVVSGRVRAAFGDPVSSWANLTSLLTGGLFVATGAYLAAVYLAVDSDRDRQPELRRYFTRRALVSGLVTGALAGATMVQLRTSAPPVFTRLTTGRGLPLVVVSVLAGLAVLVALTLDIVRPVRPLAVLAVAAVAWGWAISQYPYLLPPGLTIAAAAVPRAAQISELVVIGIIVILVIPSFALLFRLAQSGRLAEAEGHPPGSGPPGGGSAAVARAPRVRASPRGRPRLRRRLRRSWPIAVAAAAITVWGLRRRGTRAR